MPPAVPGLAVGALLGRGGMGAVYAAEHLATGRPVAVKVLSAQVPAHRLRAEARALARLHHPHVLPVFDTGTTDGTAWIVMARAAGPLPRGPRTPAQVRAVLVALLAALGHAHARGVLHLDVKPSNVLVDADGAPLLADFGVARMPGDTAWRLAASRGWAPPEQLAGALSRLGPWTDLYALGAVAWTLWTGERPFATEDTARVPSPLPRASPGFAGWVARLLQPDPAARFRCAADAAHALAACDVSGETGAGTVASGPTATLTGTVGWTPAAPAPPPTLSLPPAAPAPLRATPPPDPAPHPVAAVGLGLIGLRPAPFVGRVQERAQLWGLLHAASTGQVAGLEVHGPAGVGRSRLLDWFTTAAAATGAAHTFAFSAGDAPGAALKTALRVQADDDPREGLAGLVPDGLAARLSGTLGALATASWLVDFARAADRPVVVTLDDVHADPTLHALAAALRDRPAPLVWVASVRADAPARSRPLGPRLELAPLAPGARRQLVAHLLPLEPALAGDVVARTAGNPLFAVELVRDWVGRGLLSATPGGFRRTPGAALDLPADLRVAWTRRVDELVDALGGASDAPDRTSDALELAAALGDRVDRATWHALADPGAADAVERALLDQGLARTDPAGWAFAHGMLREAIAHRARAGGRWAAHNRRCADHLGPSPPPRDRLRLGRHLWAAGDVTTALRHWLDGARFAQAQRHLDHCDALLAEAEPALATHGTPDLVAMHTAVRAFNLHTRGDAVAAAPLARAALDALPDDTDLDAFFVVQVAHDVARALGEDRIGFARAMVDRARVQPPFRRLAALSALVTALPGGAERTAALDALAALIAALPTPLDGQTTIALTNAGNALTAGGRPEVAARALRLALDHGVATGMTSGRVWTMLGNLERAAGRLDASTACFSRAREALRESGAQGTEVIVGANIALNALLQEDWGAAAATLDALSEVPANLARALDVLAAWAALGRGDLPAVHRVLDAAAARSGPVVPQTAQTIARMRALAEDRGHADVVARLDQLAG